MIRLWEWICQRVVTLTHGAPVSFSGKTYSFVAYNVDKETELLDYDAILAQAKEVQPNSSLLGLQLTHVSLILLNSVKLLML